MLCSPVKVNQLFRGTYEYCVHLPGWRVSQARNLHKACSKQNFLAAGCPLLAGFLLNQIFDPEYGGVCSSKPSVDLHWTEKQYIPHLNNHCYETSNPPFIEDSPNQVLWKSYNWFWEMKHMDRQTHMTFPPSVHFTDLVQRSRYKKEYFNFILVPLACFQNWMLVHAHALSQELTKLL
jgi:hypothetical protein